MRFLFCFPILLFFGSFYGLVVKTTNELTEPPIKPWHCENEYVKRVVVHGIQSYNGSVDLLQQYLEQNLQVVFNTDGGAWFVSVSRVVHAYNDIDDGVIGSQWYCMINEITPLSTLSVIVIRIDDQPI